jgi:protein SCO1
MVFFKLNSEKEMNKSAIIAICIALLLPLTGYFLMKGLSNKNIHPPRHFIYDTVINKTEKGKRITDTVWHKVPDYTFTNQLGRPVTWNDMEGKVIVADFFFTHCPTICPALTRNMKQLQETVRNNERVGDREPDFIQFLSFSVDPERDSVAALKKWADRFQVNPVNWWLLTGSKKDIYEMSIDHLKLGLVDGDGIDTNFLHTDYFVLIDKNRHIRGYYHGLDTASLYRLSQDIIFLNLEKDPNRKSFFAGKLEIMAVAMLTAILGAFLLVYFLKKSAASKTDATKS